LGACALLANSRDDAEVSAVDAALPVPRTGRTLSCSESAAADFSSRPQGAVRDSGVGADIAAASDHERRHLSTVLRCRHPGEALGPAARLAAAPSTRGCRTNQTGCTNLTTADFADLVRAAQAGRAGPPRRKWFTPESAPCRRRTKSRDTRWFVRQPHREPTLSFSLIGCDWSELRLPAARWAGRPAELVERERWAAELAAAEAPNGT
jgi:hypothetical protein